MSVRLIGEVLEHSISKGSNLLTLIVLADSASDESRSCFPSVKFIARRTRLSERAVQLCLASLRETGEIKIEPRQRKDGSSSSNTYIITSDWQGAKIAPQGANLTGGEGEPQEGGGRTTLHDRVKEASPHIIHHIPVIYPSDNPSAMENRGQNEKTGKPDFTLEPEKQTIEQQTWNAYSTAFQKRYKTNPVRNAKVNSQIKALTARLGAEAPDVASFFVYHNASWYVSKCHSVGNLLADAEKLRTEWATGRRITATQARQEDATETNKGQVERMREHYGEA